MQPVPLGPERVPVFYEGLELLSERREIVAASFLGKLFVFGRRGKDDGRDWGEGVAHACHAATFCDYACDRLAHASQTFTVSTTDRETSCSLSQGHP